MPDYRKVGLAVIRDGRILLCRKKNGLPHLILPGGKPEPGESSLDCLHRELSEELGLVTATNVTYLGSYTSPAAVAPGDPAATVHIELYLGQLVGHPRPSGEISELVWFDPASDQGLVAPSLADLILPHLRQRGFIL
ncbi:MAG TPA: NUDIX domain-containing protein [Bryobacteraceae bacterium]|jgi:8-oxo-dGTP diphosphatase|nr:NUDIX domain-containing protein [Bryobacteraceae bacterium]